MFDKNKDLLPVGSVVILKGASLRLMIIGLLPLLEDNKSYYDYCGCIYPEGLIDFKTMAFFNRESIERVYSLGGYDEATNNHMKILRQREKEILSNSNYVKKKIDDINNVMSKE